MKTHQVIQGSPEWKALRKQPNCFTASEAPAMLDLSKYQTRDELLHQKATCAEKEIDAATQRRFNDGHEAEAKARVIAEEIAGNDLFPVTGSEEIDGLILLASFDGLDMEETMCWENKLWNAEFAAQVQRGIVPDTHWPQLEQQLLISGAEQALFTVSDGTKEKTVHVWYESKPERRAQLIAGWKQFAADLAAYVPAEAKAAPTAAPQETLPAVTVQVTGSLAVIDNLNVFGEALTKYVAKINQQPQSDDDFATLEAQVKILKGAEDALTAAENGALAQAADIDAMRRAVANYREIARQARLTAEKVVKAEKENRKNAIVSKGIDALRSFRDQLSGKFPMPMSMPDIAADFHGAARGLKTIASIQNAINTELARAKIEAQNVADKIEANLKTIGAQAEHTALFADYRTLALKDSEYVALEVDRRITAYKAEQESKLAAERERIAKEEREKIEAKAAQDRVEQARQAAEEQARIATEALNKPRDAAQIAEIGAPLKLSGKMVEVPREPQFTIATKTVTREEAEQLYPAADTTGNRITLGDINGALEPIRVTEAFLSSLGIDPVARDKRACLYREVDFPAICRSVAAHVTSKIDAFLKVA